MNKHRLIKITAAIILIAGALSYRIWNASKKTPALSPHDLWHGKRERIYSPTGGDAAVPHQRIYRHNPQTGEKELIGYAFFTSDLAPEERGYAGPINVMVETDISGAIMNITVVSHTETPGYVSGENLGAFIEQFISRGANDALTIGKDIDAISGATATSEAIARAVKKSLTIIYDSLIDSAGQRAGSSAPLPVFAPRTSVERVKETIRNAGLVPHEARYWGTSEQ